MTGCVVLSLMTGDASSAFTMKKDATARAPGTPRSVRNAPHHVAFRGSRAGGLRRSRVATLNPMG